MGTGSPMKPCCRKPIRGGQQAGPGLDQGPGITQGRRGSFIFFSEPGIGVIAVFQGACCQTGRGPAKARRRQGTNVEFNGIVGRAVR